MFRDALKDLELAILSLFPAHRSMLDYLNQTIRRADRAAARVDLYLDAYNRLEAENAELEEEADALTSDLARVIRERDNALSVAKGFGAEVVALTTQRNRANEHAQRMWEAYVLSTSKARPA